MIKNLLVLRGKKPHRFHGLKKKTSQDFEEMKEIKDVPDLVLGTWKVLISSSVLLGDTQLPE